MERERRRWERARREHAAALAAYRATAERLDAQGWAAPRAPGAWSPAQITEHLALAYDAVLRELREGVPMRPRLSAGWQRVLRWLLLPHVLFHRTLPLRAAAPREIRPGEAPAAAAALLQRLEAQAAACEAALAAAAPGRRLQHPYFGPISPLQTLRFVAVHLEHHRRQL